jgi:AcrR family transcriptional regulator/transposase-like protein
MSKSSFLSSNKSLRRQPQQKRGQQRVEKILLAAAEVFAKAGFAAATIQQIADRANTAVGSIYQFFPDKLAIFHSLSAKHIQRAEMLDREFLAADTNRPLVQLTSEFVDIWASYLEQPIPRCIILQYYLQPIPGLFPSIDEMQTRQSIQIEKHAQMYRHRNPNLSEAKSKLLSEVGNNLCSSLFLHALQSNEKHRQEIYAEIKDVIYSYLYPYIGDHLLIAHNQKMICPDCQSDRVAKNGRQQGKQRYICKGCGRQFVDRYVERGYPLEIRHKCLDLHHQGISFREIERSTGVSHNTVINWVKSLESKSDAGLKLSN